SGACTAFPKTVSATAAATSVVTRRHWYGTGYQCCAFHVINRNMSVYAATVEIAAPIIPYGGISAKLRPMFSAAAAPVMIQLNCVRRTRPMPTAITVYAAYAVDAKHRRGTTRDPA